MIPVKICSSLCLIGVSRLFFRFPVRSSFFPRILFPVVSKLKGSAWSKQSALASFSMTFSASYSSVSHPALDLLIVIFINPPFTFFPIFFEAFSYRESPFLLRTYVSGSFLTHSPLKPILLHLPISPAPSQAFFSVHFLNFTSFFA